MLNRRDLVVGGSAVSVAGAALLADRLQAKPPAKRFAKDFLWGAATAAYQVEGNNVGSDVWTVEHVKPSAFREPSGDACDSFHRWPLDLDIARSLNLTCYRFSIEWARIEPEPGQFSVAMLDHYRAMLDGCRARGLKAVVTFNHFTCPRWFAMRGGWTNPEAPQLFARFCDRAARALASGMHAAATLNEPNLMRLLRYKLPPQALAGSEAVQVAAAHASGSDRFVATMIESAAQTEAVLPIMIAAHHAGRAAIKAVRSDLPVGVSLAIEDDQAVGAPQGRDRKRALCYDAWLEAARGDDFVGVQNYERARIGAAGTLPPPADAVRNAAGAEIYPASLAGAVRYAWETARVPVLVTEHGVGTADDRQRAALIPAALDHLHDVMAEGVPVLGYIHWSLLDNFEWVFGYGPRYGLASVDSATFKRTLKPSSAVLAAIARANAV
ncbi:glycoside hydrolase family 1 protein [Sphingomonas glacialis]|uniref:Glycoside hydrolase family 1 protein n=1 Tax=Sphingomonas glacialis TaxID=658225 RepID=A0A502FG60_9SPHN|nr:family 1 glycosylhydrolase [Sphingomonas glacialis]TPG48371.1 glycoside hydrolase family 1 protein [Sphingomonas glacialis]